MTINKRVIAGSLTALRPGDPGVSYVYGTTVPPATVVWNPASNGLLGLEYTIEPSAADVRNAGTYEYTPVLLPSNNPNFDISGVQLVKSEPLVITKAPLTVTPLPLEIAQGALEYEFKVSIQGYRFTDTLATVGPHDIDYEVSGFTSTTAIGQALNIVKVAGATELPNYTVTYNDLAGGATVYGLVTYHSNYPGTGKTDVTIVAPEKYTSPAAPVTLKTLAALGIADHGMQFLGWALDPAGTTMFADGTPIGNTSITLYAQWRSSYTATFKYVDWIRGGNLHMPPLPLTMEFEPGTDFPITDALFKLPGFGGRFAVMIAESGLNPQSIPWGQSFINMPHEDVEITLHYMAGNGM